jgi:hypothetical protein
MRGTGRIRIQKCDRISCNGRRLRCSGRAVERCGKRVENSTANATNCAAVAIERRGLAGAAVHQPERRRGNGLLDGALPQRAVRRGRDTGRVLGQRAADAVHAARGHQIERLTQI